MDQWNQRMMFPGMPAGIPQNANNQQNFYRPTNPQQFYPIAAGAQFHSGGFQTRPPFPQNMNPMAQNFLPHVASQPHPMRPMKPAEFESLKKKRNFEEQQKRLMALKQKGSGGGSMASQVENPLNDLFGKKGNSGGMASLLGSLGDVSRSKSSSSTSYQGPQGSSNLPGQAPPSHNVNSASNIPVPAVSNIASSNWNTPGLPNVNPTAGPSQSSGDFEQFQGFSSKTMQDDFGDFQQSSSMQFPAMPSTRQSEVPRSNQSDVFSGTSQGVQTRQQPVNVGHVPVTSSVQQPDAGDFHQSLSMQFPAVPSTQQSEVQRNILLDMSGVSTGDKTGQQSVNTGHVESKVPVTSSINAPVTPSIEDLMKKSLTLDNQSQSSGKRFEKPKITKTIKIQPSHFAESVKASKFENIDSLSEMFTIPQAALAQPVEVPISHVTANSSDDWSDFSSATETVFQEQNPSTGLAPPSPGQRLPISFIQNPPSGQRVPTSGLGLPTSESTTFNWECGNEGHLSTLQEPRGEMGIFSQYVSTAQAGTMWIPHVPSGSDVMLVGVNTPVSQGNSGQGILSGSEFGELRDVPRHDTLSVAVQVQVSSEVSQETPAVDPEQAIYGVSLPDWSKNTNMLPVVYRQIHKMCSSPPNDIISTSQLYPILLSSDLPRDKLGDIWSKCNKAVPGELNEKELYLILGMVALAQVGLQVNKLTLEKLASCVTAPIPSFPESIFQNEVNQTPDTPLPSTTATNPQPEQTKILPTDPDCPADTIFHPTPHVDAVKHPDWSKWKTSKAGQIDDKFSDFQILKPKDTSVSTSTALPNLNWSSSATTLSPRQADASFGSSQSLSLVPSVTGSSESANQEPPKTVKSEEFSLFGKLQSSREDPQSFAAVERNKSDIFGEMTGASEPSQQFGSFENKAVKGSPRVMSVPLQASQRYTLTGEDESVDHHEKAWLKCLTSCFTVIMKSCQTLQNISDPNLMNEIFSSQHGISHFSAIIEIYCISQRVKASVLKSAPNNKKLKQSLQNIDNIWKTYTSFEPFKKLLPMENFNFSACHVNDGDDVNMSCGVCLLNVDKSCMNSSQKSHRGKLNYGNREYHTTCANFWCNKVDSVLPSLQFNNSLI